ncbi:hypothetical protein PITCH_A270007 [uncultured Desulfobacterium sp.]|uniref:Uncharacterized protein n=1 Tax=uncultured Desulfobacterium sp. TaxID=201089 RepID=A0A445MZ36_9BACT|nr:hypothetical protein PITCH_A270007 [uncultured Desulfobacterium sp.]
MSNTRNFLSIANVLYLCMAFGLSPVFGGSIKQPVIYSYYWPIGKAQEDLLRWNMETPTVIDIPWQDIPKWREAKIYWEKRGRALLYRVYPFKGVKTEDEMYELFIKNLEKSKGIAIDEIITNKLSNEQAEMFINVLKRVRKAYPEKIVAVWCSGNWDMANSLVLKTIRDYADMFLPELYISQKTAKESGLGKFKLYLKNAETLAPGITKKTVVGLGMFPEMIDDPSQRFRDHLSAQIELLGTDPFFGSVLGIALCAPVYLQAEDQQWLDGILKKYFSERK